MINVVILEDNKDSLDVIQTVIKSFFPDLNILKSFNKVDEAYKFIKNNDFDWLILDIDLGSGIDGFDLLRLLDFNYQFKVVFYSGDSSRAIEAIRHNAFDFLTKPLSITDMNNAIKRYYLLKENEDSRLNKLNPEFENKSIEKEKEQILKINTHKKTLFIKVNDILYVDANGAYSVIYTLNGGQFKCSKNISNISQLIDDTSFSRISRSLLVNMTHIEYINKQDLNESNIVFKNGKQLLISNRIRKNLNDLIEK